MTRGSVLPRGWVSGCSLPSVRPAAFLWDSIQDIITESGESTKSSILGPSWQTLLVFFTPSIIFFAKQAQKAKQNKQLNVSFLAREKVEVWPWESRQWLCEAKQTSFLPARSSGDVRKASRVHPLPCLSRRCRTEHKPPAITPRALRARWPWSVSGCLWCAPECYFKGIPRWCKACNS